MAFVQIDKPQDLVDMIEVYLDDLYEKAIEIVKSHTALVREMDSKLDWNKRSIMFPRVKRAAGSFAFALEWYQIHWVGHKSRGGRKQHKIYIPRGRGQHAYQEAKLLKFAKDWERELVLNTEATLSNMRRETHNLTRALFPLRAAVKASAA